MNGEVMTQDENMPVSLGADNLLQMAAKAEKMVEAINRIKRAALKVTNERDWTNQNGNPYLQVSGSEKVARLFGISWRIDPPQFTTEDDGHYSYTYKGYFDLGPASIEFEGSRGSKDAWYSKAHGKDVPVSEIDKNDVKKAALTNTIGNGVTRILGIRNLSWDDLKEAGLDVSKIGKVEYTKPEMSGEAKDLKVEMEKMLAEMSGNDKETIGNLVYKYTSFTDKTGKEVSGKTSLMGLTEKSIPVVYGKIKEAYGKWKAAENEPA
jgi:hypothetical protein